MQNATVFFSRTCVEIVVSILRIFAFKVIQCQRVESKFATIMKQIHGEYCIALCSETQLNVAQRAKAIKSFTQHIIFDILRQMNLWNINYLKLVIL